MLGQPTGDGACSVDQLPPEVVIGASSDAAEPRLAAKSYIVAALARSTLPSRDPGETVGRR